MASAIMHLCIAKKINEKLKRNEKELFLGAIAPDLSKQIGDDRSRSHFGLIPDISLFTAKYSNFVNNDFELGYYIHLLSDIIWQNDYVEKVIINDNVKFLSGASTKVLEEDISYLVYNDYTNLNSELIDFYNLPLDLFFDEVITPKTEINEVDISKLQVIVDKMGLILTSAKKEKNYVFDIKSVVDYIDKTAAIILSRLDGREVDLHIHSNHSDGSETIEDILKICESKKLEYISITDHDKVSQYKDVSKKRKLYSGKIISGCELTTTFKGTTIEILAYGFDIKKMDKIIKKNISPREKKLKLISARVSQVYLKKGIKFDKKSSKGSLRELFNNIITYSENDVFFNNIECKGDFKKFFREEYSDYTSAFFIDLSDIHPTIDEVVSMIHRANGYAFLAHLYEYDPLISEELFKNIKEFNLDGLECFHTEHTEDETISLIKYCRENNLFISGGSDFHGVYKENHDIGNVKIKQKYINFIEKVGYL